MMRGAEAAGASLSDELRKKTQGLKKENKLE